MLTAVGFCFREYPFSLFRPTFCVRLLWGYPSQRIEDGPRELHELHIISDHELRWIAIPCGCRFPTESLRFLLGIRVYPAFCINPTKSMYLVRRSYLKEDSAAGRLNSEAPLTLLCFGHDK